MIKRQALPRKDEITDEAGAQERFKGLLKRVLNTPPPRKQSDAPKTKRPKR